MKSAYVSQVEPEMESSTGASNKITLFTGDAKQQRLREQLDLLKEFLLTKKVEGCSIRTIQNYHDRIMQLIHYTTKDIRELSTKDLRKYLYTYQETRDVSYATLDGIRLVLSSFYGFLEEEDYILKNPMRKIHKIRSEHLVKKPFSDEELERIRGAAKNIRDLAIIDLLYSSGIRISELTALNISDINFKDREMLVKGKGGRERFAYFNARTKIELLDYLDTRCDREPALFIQRRDPPTRLKSGGVQRMLKKIEQSENIPNVHPHRFRRTLATNLLNKGMTLEQVQSILGHKRIETTLIYAQVNKDSVKSNHQKFTF